ncbi:RNA repair domain-containing protein [Nitrosospira sp. Is2]
MGPDGAIREVPLHRIREVYKNGELIWHRGA